ncbi:S49 family peptidase [Hyphobacterium sp.]|uniref:S49 family peptidase n=1 Tax=Hyphobacterium sp. TaxID=2004662 RepID=UPI003BA9E6CA
MPLAQRLAQIAGRPVLIAPTAAPALLSSLREEFPEDRPGLLGSLARGVSRLPIVNQLPGLAGPEEGGERRSSTETDEAEVLAYAGPPCAPDAEFQEEDGYFLEGNVAIIEIQGALWDRTGWGWGSRLWSYDRIGAAIRAARADQRVAGIFLRIDSPGGLIDGLFALVEEIEAGSARHGGKPIWAFAAPSAFSAAYAIASACDHIVSMVEGEVGSIGAVVVHFSEKGWLDAHGLKVTPIEYPEGKTAGAWWEDLPEQAREDLQARVTRAAKLFIRHVAATRPDLSEEQIIALKARCFSSDDESDGGRSALRLGLIDEIQHETAALAALAESVRGTVPGTATPPAAAPDTEAAAATAASTSKGASAMDANAIAALQAAAAKGDEEAKRKLAAIELIVGEDQTDEETEVEEEEEETPAAATEEEETEAEEEEEDGTVDAKTARAILALPEAKSRPKLAGELATEPGMTVKTAKRLLGKAGKETGSRMSGVPDPRVKASSGTGQGSGTGDGDIDQAMGAFTKAYGKGRLRKDAA